VERTLGVLKKRFPILKVATFHMLKNQVKLPIAAAFSQSNQGNERR